MWTVAGLRAENRIRDFSNTECICRALSREVRYLRCNKIYRLQVSVNLLTLEVEILDLTQYYVSSSTLISHSRQYCGRVGIWPLLSKLLWAVSVHLPGDDCDCVCSWHLPLYVQCLGLHVREDASDTVGSSLEQNLKTKRILPIMLPGNFLYSSDGVFWFNSNILVTNSSRSVQQTR
jgi:hypothetical protein